MENGEITVIPENRQRILTGLHNERVRQDEKHGDSRDQYIGDWVTILGEELGELDEAHGEILAMKFLHKKFGDVCKAQLDLKFHQSAEFQKLLDHYRLELEQCAAVCVAMLEDFDRNYRV